MARFAVGTRIERIRTGVRYTIGVYERSLPILRALQEAAASDEAAQARLAKYDDDRRQVMVVGMNFILDGQATDEVIDAIWTLVSPEVWTMLTARRGWSRAQAENWLVTMSDALVANRAYDEGKARGHDVLGRQQWRSYRPAVPWWFRGVWGNVRGLLHGEGQGDWALAPGRTSAVPNGSDQFRNGQIGDRSSTSVTYSQASTWALWMRITMAMSSAFERSRAQASAVSSSAKLPVAISLPSTSVNWYLREGPVGRVSVGHGGDVIGCDQTSLSTSSTTRKESVEVTDLSESGSAAALGLTL